MIGPGKWVYTQEFPDTRPVGRITWWRGSCSAHCYRHKAIKCSWAAYPNDEGRPNEHDLADWLARGVAVPTRQAHFALRPEHLLRAP